MGAQEAEARVEWARRCALSRVPTPGQGFDVGGAMTDYREFEPGANASGVNAYQGNVMDFEINATYAYSLFRSQPSGQFLEPSGYYKWVSASKRQRPYYPSFGSTASVFGSDNVPLHPHPQLLDCNLYTDRSGYNRAGTFFVNVYCNASPAQLTPQVPMGGQADGAGGEKHFTLTVPEGSVGLYIAATGGTGNADLYVKRALPPTTGAYDCASTYGGNYDACYFAAPAPGTYHVMLKGAQSYSGVTVYTSWNELQRGGPVSNLYAGAGVEKHYTFYVPPNTLNVWFGLSGGAGDADLYVRQGAPPSVGQYDCRPYTGGNSESCTFSSAAGGVYHVMVRAFTPFSGVSLVADYTERTYPPGGCYPQESLYREQCEYGACAPQPCF